MSYSMFTNDILMDISSGRIYGLKKKIFTDWNKFIKRGDYQHVYTLTRRT